MTHIAIAEQLNGKVVEWLEKVSDGQDNLPSTPRGGINMSREPSAAQKMIGDFAPKLVSH
jgi:4-carboxymuconolactone decarboxylase